MTRRRSSAPGRVRPDRRRSLSLLSVLVALVLAGCAGASDDSVTAAPTRSASPGSGSEAPTDGPTTTEATPSMAPTDEPTPTDEPSTTDEPTDEPTPTDEPSSTAGSGPAAACAGSDENRDFFAAVADDVDWPVYCPVLGSGWFVDSGTYRLAGGGWMEIAYRGPGGARLEFREGAACSADGCLPSGQDAGETAFGDMSGTLLLVDGGRLAIVVEPGETPSWTVLGSGLEQAEFEAIAADLERVGG